MTVRSQPRRGMIVVASHSYGWVQEGEGKRAFRYATISRGVSREICAGLRGTPRPYIRISTLGRGTLHTHFNSGKKKQRACHRGTPAARSL